MYCRKPFVLSLDLDSRSGCGRVSVQVDVWSDEFIQHDCIKTRNSVKDDLIELSYETVNKDGGKIIHAYGLTGKIYRLTFPNPAKLAEPKKQASEGNKRIDYEEGLQRGLHRTFG